MNASTGVPADLRIAGRAGSFRGCSIEGEWVMQAARSKLHGGRALSAAVLMLAFSLPVVAQTMAAPPAGTASATPDNAILLTVFLKHDYKAFPPEGIEVVSWYVTMGIGQIVTLRLPASRIREINRVLEDTAWGPYRTEFFISYDYKAVGLAAHDKAK